MKKPDLIFASLLVFISGIIVMILFITGCTFAVNLVHTEGVASDVVDEIQKPQADVSPSLSLPLVGK